jgi:magnesium transporter
VRFLLNACGALERLRKRREKQESRRPPVNVYKLVNAKSLKTSPPELIFRQLCVLVIDDRTVITVRKDKASTHVSDHFSASSSRRPSSDAVDLEAGRQESSSERSVVTKQPTRRRTITEVFSSSPEHAAMLDDGEEHRLSLKDIREQIDSGAMDVRQLSARFLGFRLLEYICEENYTVRDKLMRWSSAIEREITNSGNTQGSSAGQSQHLYMFSQLADSYKNAITPVSDTLLEWKDSANKLKTDSLSFFFEEEDIYFRDLQDELSTMQSELHSLSQKGEKLQELHSAMREERMNRILYALTLITTVFVPAQFLTGLYGMNFSYMPELNYHYGYAIFWGGVFVLTVISGISFRRGSVPCTSVDTVDNSSRIDKYL